MFDKIIANPPFDKNLHLKILREAMKHVEKEGGEIVNLSPVDFISNLGKYHGWNKDGLVDYCLEHVNDIDILDHRESNDIFGLGNQIEQLGIWYLKSSAKGKKITDYRKEIDVKVSGLMYNTKPSLWSKYKRVGETTKKYTVNVFKWHEEYDNPKNCIIVPEGNTNNSYCVEFDTKEERDNFISSFDTKLFRYAIGKIKNCNPAHLPFLPTYKKQWNDPDLFEYFKLTKEEIATIEEEMKMKH